MMKITIDHIKEKPVTLNAEEPAESFPVLREMQQRGECTFTAPVHYDITVGREFDHLRATGSVTTRVEMDCSRCLERFGTGIESRFTILFRRGTPEEAALEEEVELAEEDLISASYDGNEIDFTHEIEEQIAMEVPVKPLCREECKGLCPDCGTDLNSATCSCGEKRINFKFSALKDFKVSR